MSLKVVREDTQMGATFVFARQSYSRVAGVAQLVEHQLPKLRVAGSNPVSRLETATVAQG
jgi:hypothetical protein